jgi:hypothetical protein
VLDSSAPRPCHAAVLAFLLTAGGSSLATGTIDLPLPSTPGSVDAAVTQDNIHQTVCVAGYTKMVRPPFAYTDRLKREMLAGEYAEQGDLSSTQLDHLVPLLIGGHPSDPANLWPQSYRGSRDASYKDNCERRTGQAVCSGQVSLVDAQRGFMENWIQWCERLN